MSKKKDTRPMTLEEAYYALSGKNSGMLIPTSNSSVGILTSKKIKPN